MSAQPGSSGSGSVRKAVKTFEIAEGDLSVPATVFAFKHDLGTADVQVSVLDKLGRKLKQVTVTVQDENMVVVQNTYDWNNGDKIVVVG